MILYKEKPKESTKRTLALISEFSKVAGYKGNIQKTMHFYIQIMNNLKKKLQK